MQGILGRTPTPHGRRSNRKLKYDDLWAALRKAAPGEGIGIERKDHIRRKSPSMRRRYSVSETVA
jgi:hypothetical protein